MESRTEGIGIDRETCRESNECYMEKGTIIIVLRKRRYRYVYLCNY